MNSLDEVRVAGEGLERGCLTPAEEGRDVVLLHSQIRALEPGQRLLQVAPDPLKRIQLGAVGRQEHEAHVGRDGEPLGRVGRTIVQPQEIETVRERLREQVDQNLAVLGVPIRQLQEEALARGGRHRAIDRAPLEDLVNRSDGLPPTGGQAPAANGQSPAAAFIVAEDADRARIGGWKGLLQRATTARVKGGNRVRVFWCDWGGPLEAWS
jgi:hypothetical protein